MPIHLGKLSRREFLARALVAGAGLAVAPQLLAAPKASNPNSWALFSDTHIAADKAFAIRGVNVSEHMAAACDDVLALDHTPAAVLVAGDCAYNTGQSGDYATFLEKLLPLRKQGPVHLALGNHDNRERFWQALPEEKSTQAEVANRQVAMLSVKEANWYILDSLEETASTPGLLGRPQLDWLAANLDANPDKPGLVLVHHNPGLSGNMGLKDTMNLFEVIRPRKQVKAYIFGHTHTWRVEQDISGIHLINLPAVAYVFKEGEPSGWVHAQLEGSGIQLTLRCIDKQHKLHGQQFKLKWRTE